MIHAAALVLLALSFPGAGDTAPKPVVSAKPPSASEVRAAVQRGIALLLEKQEAYGEKADRAPETVVKREWPYEGVYRVGGRVPIGYRIGGTAICGMALIEATGGKPEGQTKAAILRALDFVLEGLGDAQMTGDFSEGYDVRGWGHAYALSFLLRLRGLQLVPAARRADVEGAIDALVTMLQQTEIKQRGGWNYSRPQGDDSDPSTFMSAPTLQILFEARAQGEDVDAAVVERGLKALEDARLETGAFQYGSDKAHQSGQGFEAVPGAIGRMAICETTLLLAGRGDAARVKGALEAFFEHWEWLEKRRKQKGTHVPPYMIAPYYFFYAHRYAAQAIELLPEADRAALRARLLALLWKVREEDGGWNDRVFPRSVTFGTAMTMLALQQPSLPRPAGWPASVPAPR